MNFYNLKIFKGIYFSIIYQCKNIDSRDFNFFQCEDIDLIEKLQVGDHIHYCPVLISGEIQNEYDNKVFEIVSITKKINGCDIEVRLDKNYYYDCNNKTFIKN